MSKYAKARKFIRENGCFLSFNANDICDYESLKAAAQEVETMNSFSSSNVNVKYLYDLIESD